MSDQVTAAAALCAAAVYISRVAYELVTKALGKTGAQKDACRADLISIKTDLSSSALQNSMNTQTRLLQEIKDSQQDTRDGVRELITLGRRHERGMR